MRTVTARIQWRTESEGGRKHAPPGPRYSTVARFLSAEKSWLEEAWSLVVEYESELSAEGVVTAAVRFLVEGGPEEVLAVGGEFELMEGLKVVATGVVISERTPEENGG